MNKIDKKYSITDIIVSASIVVGCLFWFYGVSVDAKQGSKAYDMIMQIKESLIRIETKLGTLPKKEE